ncbi:MAG: SIR2 family protein, partial [Magnetococcus sp. YQC-5]
MQITPHSPDIPNALLQAHEEGRVVFFCGAGISYPAGLPGFRDLVDQLYTELDTERTPTEEQPYARGQYDATLDLLERRTPGERLAVRKKLLTVLKPKLDHEGAIDTHAALLQLARGRDGAVRLVTTNFDRIFQHLIVRDKLAIQDFPAPLLPIPKKNRWNGVVYLHGLLPETLDESALQRLVLSSGDFGLAYLIERWAARFVSELFRNFVVCFVGYSINDPVLRYMMDALAADRMLGEITPPAYAFGGYKAGKEEQQRIEWEAKGVTPVLYETPTDSDHSALHRTLKAWAATYRDGITGKENIVTKYAMTHPSASTPQDDFVGRMLWALSDESGLPARRFAHFDPVPSLDWLEYLSVNRYQQSDLPRFGVPFPLKQDDKLAFSMTRRPAPSASAPWMMLVNGGSVGSQWDAVMNHLAHWLTRHLDDPVLVLWLAKQGGQLQYHFVRCIDHRLNELHQLEIEGKTDELERIRNNAPRAIPRPMVRTLWRLLLTGRVKPPWRDRDMEYYIWQDQFKYDGLTPTLRMQLRELLAPCVLLRQPFREQNTADHADEPKRLRELVEWELVLSIDDAYSSLDGLEKNTAWQKALPLLLDDIQLLLRDALDLMRELGEADDWNDRSHWNLPSISPHPQNRSFHEWVALIELLRDAWLATLHSNPT